MLIHKTARLISYIIHYAIYIHRCTAMVTLPWLKPCTIGLLINLSQCASDRCAYCSSCTGTPTLDVLLQAVYAYGQVANRFVGKLMGPHVSIMSEGIPLDALMTMTFTM